MKRLYIAAMIFSFFSFQIGFAGHDKADHGARSSGLAGADVALSGFWSLRNNQAGLASLKNPTGGLFYENRFGMKELGYQSAGFVYPFQGSALGVTANYFGDELYHESAFGLAYGMRIAEGFSAGIQLDYFSSFTDAEEQVKNNAVTFEAGLLYELTPEITIGVHAYNPLEVSMNSSAATEVIPSNYSLGAAFKVDEKLLLTTEVEKTQGYGESVRAGVEYEVVDKTFLRAGVATKPGLFSFGFETSWNHLTLQIASSMHEVLGFSPMVSVLFEF